jgi:uncharacterized protein involved in exopolysaccharide biosynthesis
MKELPHRSPSGSRKYRSGRARQNPFQAQPKPQQQDEELSEEQARRKQRQRRQAEAEAFWARKEKQSGSQPGGSR